MKPAGFTNLIKLFSTTLFLIFCFSTIAFAQGLNAIPIKKNIHPKVAHRLLELKNEYKKGQKKGVGFAQKRNMPVDDQNKITLYLVSDPETSLDESRIQALEAKVIKKSGNLSKIQCPINAIETIADTINGVKFIKLPDRLLPTFVQSEGVDLTGAAAYHSEGYTGSGIRVGVIDVGFAGLSSAISRGELPDNVVEIDCTGSTCVSGNFTSETDPHGTAVAEIVYDMAPGSLLYLIKVWDTLDLADAKNFAISQGIKIINFSLVVANTNFYDGECWFRNPVCTADSAFANDILWVTAAGNEANQHYEAPFSDIDNDGLHNVSGSDETLNIVAEAGDSIHVYLTWNAWPTTDQDYDLYLYDSAGTLMESSLNPQTGTQLPTEEIVYSVPADGTYHLAVNKSRATFNHRLEVYSAYHNLTPAVASSSLLSPADAQGAIAVGAIDYSDWTTGPQEPFSSRGPTNDGRIKPDICGPDGISNDVFGTFSGTSASCAHVTGAAALVLSRNQTCSASELMNALTASAIDMGISGKDNIYGYGRLNLDIDDDIVCEGINESDGGGGGGCFIATAAYGSSMAPHVKILREMRDRFLLTNRIGKQFLNFYTKYSPPAADFIAGHDHLRMFVRMSLFPLVGISWIALKFGLVFTISLMVFLIVGLIWFVKNRNFSKDNNFMRTP
ncbi:MAG: S8 family serine peptidase [Deltaproteobacteria bacterium]|jgi:subtilisin family serine protease|nr:S8 family serine peptidase [Deltaproteobacteria bacterium]MBW2711101.1 S8 family serine peptidase [Deltaproteobacteria bacterium]